MSQSIFIDDEYEGNNIKMQNYSLVVYTKEEYTWEIKNKQTYAKS
jgi:hypothetical protein